MSRRPSGSQLLTPCDLGALITTTSSQIVAAFCRDIPTADAAALASTLAAWSAALAADSGNVEPLRTEWLTHAHTVQDLQAAHRALRSAILAQLPADSGIGARTSECFGQLFADSVAQATERMVRSSLSELAAQKDQHRHAEEALVVARREREVVELERANFYNLFRQSPEMVCILSGPEHRFELVNEAHVRVLGFDATGQAVRDAQPESVEIHHILDDVYRTGTTAFLHEIPVTVTDRLRYFNLTYSARRDANGVPDGVMIVGVEVTQDVLARRSNQLQQLALELALQDAPLARVLEVLAQMVEMQGGGSQTLASILLADDEGRHLLHGAAPSLPAAYNAAIHGIAIGPQSGSCGTAAHERAHVIVEDIASDARWTNHRELALSHGLRACWSVPILTAQGKLLGAFALYARTARKPSEREMQSIEIAARTTSLILGRRREIRERLAGAEALREREAELKFTLASAKLGTWSLDLSNGRVTVSEEAAAMFGVRTEYNASDIAINECIHPDDRERAARSLQSAITDGTNYRAEYRVVWPNGEVRWVDSRGRVLRGEGGKLKTLSGVVMDITEQKLAAENLYASKRMLELAASGGRIGFWHVDTARGTFVPDEKMAADWGIDLATFARTSKAGMAIVHPDDRAKILSSMEKSLAGTDVYDEEFRIILPSGEERWVQSQGEFHADEAGKKTLFSGVAIDITDKKLGQIAKQRIADTIAKEREKLEMVLEQAAVPIALIEGPQHVFSFANSAYLRTFELAREILGKPAAEVLPDLVAQGFLALLDSVFQTGKALEGREVPFEYKNRQGEVRSYFFDFTYAAKRDAQHRIDGVLATIVDVTDRVTLRHGIEKANALLRAERFNLDQIIQKSPAAMATWTGPDLIFDRVNPEYAKIFPGRTLVGRELLEACPELRGQGFDEILRHVLQTGEPYTGNQVLAKIAQTPGGPTEDRYFDFKYLRINDQEGNPYGVYDFALDVTDRVLAQQKLEESSAKLRAAEELLQRAIEVANIGFYEWDRTSNRITFSAQMQKDWGIEGGTSLETVVSHIHAEDRQRVVQAIARTVETGAKYREEYRVMRPTDGQLVWIEAQGGLTADKMGNLTRFIGTSLDITLRKSTEDQLRSASIEAHNASTAKSAFLANMSHEIRTPLGAIMGFAELLKKPDLPRASSQNFVSVIERNSQHLLRIVDDILDLSKVEAGKMVFEHIEFSLPDLLSDFASLMGLRARDKGIDFALRIATPIPTLVISDPTRLRQILNNIVGNAIKFTERGLVELCIRYEDKFLELEVRDTGRGISHEQAERLFQAFVQADESTTRKFGGTGLGLVLTKRLSSAMGGDFFLKESTPAVGSVFVARIKVGVIRGTRFVDDQTLGFSTEEELNTTPERVLAGMRILVVDDSPDNRTLLSVLLEDAGALVESAPDGRRGVELALAQPFDAVLMDIQMPRMDGYQAIELLNVRGYTTPIIALTAHAMVEERERARGKGFAAFMTKPIQRDSLLHLLDGLRRKQRISEPPAPIAPVQPAPPAPTPANGVLIVEDNADSGAVMEQFLSSLGHEVRCARSGQQALALLGAGFVPNLVLLDLTLPDMSGREVLEAVRRRPECAETRVVLVSGWDNLPQRAKEMGASGWLRKPFNLTELEALARKPPRSAS